MGWVGNHVSLENMKRLNFRYEYIEGREGEGEEELMKEQMYEP